MKKLISLLLVLTMALSLAACTGNNTPDTTTGNTESTTEATTEATTPEVTGPASAQEVMDSIFANWEFEYKDSLMGGGYEATVSGAPGTLTATDTATLQNLMYIPEETLSDVTDASFVMNGMNANSFTAYTVKVSDAAAFGASMKDTLQGTQWICGFPEFLMVYTIGEYCLIAFGAFDVIPTFRTAVTTTYADAVLIYDDVMG